jgi:hypothetical protein
MLTFIAAVVFIAFTAWVIVRLPRTKTSIELPQSQPDSISGGSGGTPDVVVDKDSEVKVAVEPDRLK